MPISPSQYKSTLFNKVEESLRQIGDISAFLSPVESIMNRTDLDENAKATQIENYFNKNFSKFAGIEEVRKLLKVEVKDYKRP